MAELPNCTNTYEHIKAPAFTEDMIAASRELLDLATGNTDSSDFELLQQPSSLTDNPGMTRAYWERDSQHGYDRLAINVVSNSLIVALEHRHPEIREPFPRITLSIGMGKASLFLLNPPTNSSLDRMITNEASMREFTDRYYHTVASLGLYRHLEQLQIAS